MNLAALHESLIPVIKLDDLGCVVYSNLKAREFFPELSKDNQTLGVFAHRFSNFEDYVLLDNMLKDQEGYLSTKVHRNSNGGLKEVKCCLAISRAEERTQVVFLPVDAEAGSWASDKFDPLTNLPTRDVLFDRVDLSIRIGKRMSNVVHGLIYLDLDDFKPINDNYGHDVGDTVLLEVSQRLTSCLRESDTVSRLGGDEFVCFLNNLRDASDAKIVADRILHAIRQPYQIGHGTTEVNATLGVSLWPNDAATSDELMKAADVAMYDAKRTGKNVVSFFNAAMNEQAKERLEIEQDLRIAIRDKQFMLHFQPQFDLQTGEIIGVESLIRWNHPKKGMIPPVKFIRIAEEANLISQIGDWVLEESVRKCTEWEKLGYDIRVAVNISPKQFVNTLPGRVAQVLERYKFAPEKLEVELTEGLLVSDLSKTAEILKHLRALGVMISLDDFGTGYSSLTYLSNFPIHTLKIDRSFIGLERSEFNEKTITCILFMAKQFNLNTLAEGVELDWQRAWLKEMGCSAMQGYLMSKPLPEDELLVYLATYASRLEEVAA
jgi:diguanylate cyclase (GGDEF)-like protein